MFDGTKISFHIACLLYGSHKIWLCLKRDSRISYGVL